MSDKPDVYTRAEREGNRAAGMAMERQREETGFALVERKQFDVASLPDAEFEAGLERLKLRQMRMQRILDTVLLKSVHYGTENGTFKKPILKKAGQEELRNLFRLQLVHTDPPIIVQSEEYVSVIVTVGVMDGAGRILAPHRGACNSREKRFQRRDGKGYTYADARETLNDCLAMAEKRAGNRATMEVTGATAFLANEEEMDDALAERGDGVPESPPWTQEEKAAFVKDARAAGFSSGAAVTAFVASVIGERPVLQRDISVLREALAGWVSRRTTAVNPGGLNAEESGDARD